MCSPSSLGFFLASLRKCFGGGPSNATIFCEVVEKGVLFSHWVVGIEYVMVLEHVPDAKVTASARHSSGRQG